MTQMDPRHTEQYVTGIVNSTFTRRQLDQAKKRLLEKCRGKLAITPIEPTNVECIVDLFLKELR